MAAAVLVPTAGWVSERFGTRNVFAAAVGVFTLASLLCGLSPTLWTFVAARVLQGAAAAFMSPVGRLVVLREAPRNRIIESLGMIVWPALIGPVIGPPLGGLITTYSSWRWIFFINLPIGLMGLWLVLRFIPHHAPEKRQRFDVVGFLYTATALVALIEGLSLLAESPNARLGGLALAGAGGLLAVLAMRHVRGHDAPLVDLQACKEPSFVLSTLTAGLLGRVAINATPFLLPLMFQIGFLDSPFKAGLMLLIYMGGNLGMKVGTTQLLRHFGFRTVLVGNGLLWACGIAACSLLSPAWPLAGIGLVLVFAGMTRSMQFTALNTMAFADIPQAARTGASTMATMMFQIASALGVAVATVALSTSQTLSGSPHLTQADFEAALLVCAVLMAGSALWLLRLPHGAGARAISNA